eukprot:gene9502-10504_t
MSIFPFIFLLFLFFPIITSFSTDLTWLEEELSSTLPIDLESLPTGSCQQLQGTSAERLVNPCSSVVTYSFYVAPGKTLSYYQTLARNALNSSMLQAVPSNCGESMVALVCSQIYLKCYPGLNFANQSSLNFEIYLEVNRTFPLPFTRPCGSLCFNTLKYCNTTLLSLFGLPNCKSDRFDYSRGLVVTSTQPHRYELGARNDNPQFCHTTQLVAFAPQKETYLHEDDGSFCGSYASEIFISGGTTLNSSWTVLTPPTTIQQKLYATVASMTAQLPVYLGEECMHYMRSYFCYQAFKPPQKVTLRRALEWSGKTAVIAQLQSSKPAALNMFFYVPGFPHREICLNYSTACAKLLKSTTNSNLIPNCLAQSSTGVYLFPEANQTVQVIKTNNPQIGDLSVPSSPVRLADEHYNSSSDDYKTSCPYGYCVPEHPDHDGVNWIGATGCAANCRPNVWSESEWKRLLRAQKWVPFVSSIAGIALMCTLFVHPKELEKLYLLLHLTFLSLIASVVTLVMAFRYPSVNDSQHRFCYDNAVPQSQSVATWSPCFIQAILLLYVLLSSAATVLMMAIHHVCYNYLSYAIIHHWLYFTVQILVIFALPILPIAFVYRHDGFGFARTMPWCYVLPPTFDKHNLDLHLTAIPVIVATGLALIIIVVHRIYVVIKRWRKWKSGKRIAVSNSEHDGIQMADRPYAPLPAPSSPAPSVVPPAAVVVVTRPVEEKERTDVQLFEAQRNAISSDLMPFDGATDSCGEAPPMASTVIQSTASKSENDGDNALICSDIEEGAAIKSVSRVVRETHPKGSNVMAYLSVFVTLALYLPYLFNRIKTLHDKDSYLDSFSVWTTCIFKHYNGNDSSWESVCGSQFDDKPNLGFNIYMGIILFGNMIVIAPVAVLVLLLEHRKTNRNSLHKSSGL